MLYDKKSMEYQINREALHEMEQLIPMTLEERAALRKWVKAGHEVDSNPWDYYEAETAGASYHSMNSKHISFIFLLFYHFDVYVLHLFYLIYAEILSKFSAASS